MILPDIIKHVSSKSVTDQEASEMAKVIISKAHTLSDFHEQVRNLIKAEQPTKLIDHSISVENDFYAFRGSVVDSKDNSPVYLAQVQAWDEDFISKDDHLGSSFTNSNGEFVITFDKSKFGSLFIDRKPDIYFHVMVDDQVVLNTCKSVIKNATASKESIILKINEN